MKTGRLPLQAVTYESRDGYLDRRAVVFDRVQQENRFLCVNEKGAEMSPWAQDVTFVRFLKDEQEANEWLARVDGSRPTPKPVPKPYVPKPKPFVPRDPSADSFPPLGLIIILSIGFTLFALALIARNP